MVGHGATTDGRDAAAGRAVGLSYGLGAAAWSYLDNGLLAQQTLPNGAWTEYSYNAAKQLVAQINKDPSGTVLTQYGSLLHAGTGDLTSLLSTVPALSSLTGHTTYGYDHKRQLTDETATLLSGYDYANVFDGAGNGSTFRNDERTFNADNQLTGPGTYVYDGNGNPTTYGGTTLSFDVENRMTVYGTTLAAGYRGDGLRAWKQTTAGRTYFLYDGISVIGELDNTGTVVGDSVFGGAGLLSYNATQYQFNPLGDVAVRLDGDGSPLGYLLFDAWGNRLSGTQAEPYGYRANAGYYTNGETGLVALAYRYYTPGAGRFLNRDPIGYGGGIGLMCYVGSNPVQRIDESGYGPPNAQLPPSMVGDTSTMCVDERWGTSVPCSSLKQPCSEAVLADMKKRCKPYALGVVGACLAIAAGAIGVVFSPSVAAAVAYLGGVIAGPAAMAGLRDCLLGYQQQFNCDVLDGIGVHNN